MNQPVKIPALLSHLPLFCEMTPAELDRIAQGARELRVARNEVIFRRGDPADGFFVVVLGQVKLALSSPQGMEKVVELIGPGQSFGEAVMFMGRPYPVYAQALVETVLLHINRNVINEGIDTDPVFCRKMLAGLSIRLHRMIQTVESISLRSSAQRVIDYLLHDVDVASAGQEVCISLAANKNVIASSLNLTPETFSRVLHDLSAAGLIKVEGKEVRIVDAARLRAYDA